MPSVQRFTALDVFRGMTVCFMIIVNTPGNEATTYAPLLHAQWHGFTPTDLVFPSFMFAVGNAMSFTMKKWERQSNNTVVFKILKRTIIIFLIGYLMYWFPFVHRNGEGQLVFSPIGYTRVMGVLQRIALAYGIAALMIRFLKLSSVIRISVVLILLYWLMAHNLPFTWILMCRIWIVISLYCPAIKYTGQRALVFYMAKRNCWKKCRPIWVVVK